MGIIFSILALVCFSTASVCISRGHDKITDSQGAFISILMTFGIALIIWTALGLRNGWPSISYSAVSWFALAGVLTIFVGRVLLYSSIQKLGAIRASAVKRLNPLFSVILGVTVLGEALSGSMILGMVLIFVSFALLIVQSLKSSESMEQEDGSLKVDNNYRIIINLGYIYGPISALAYATGYLARKQGLIILPDAAFGAMLGALVGGSVYVVAAVFLDLYRTDLRNAFTVFNPWLFTAGVLSSLGQISYFVALKYSPISQIALITSFEVFLTIFITTVIFGNSEQLNSGVMVAALLATAGTIVIIFA